MVYITMVNKGIFRTNAICVIQDSSSYGPDHLGG